MKWASLARWVSLSVIQSSSTSNGSSSSKTNNTEHGTHVDAKPPLSSLPEKQPCKGEKDLDIGVNDKLDDHVDKTTAPYKSVLASTPRRNHVGAVGSPSETTLPKSHDDGSSRKGQRRGKRGRGHSRARAARRHQSTSTSTTGAPESWTLLSSPMSSSSSSSRSQPRKAGQKHNSNSLVRMPSIPEHDEAWWFGNKTGAQTSTRLSQSAPTALPAKSSQDDVVAQRIRAFSIHDVILAPCPDTSARQETGTSLLTERFSPSHASGVVAAASIVSRSAQNAIATRRNNGKIVDPAKVKTVICNNWDERGECSVPNCTYAHGVKELRPVKRHPKAKTVPCENYHKYGFCQYGRKCDFIHDEEVVSPSAVSMLGTVGRSSGSQGEVASFSPLMSSRHGRSIMAQQCLLARIGRGCAMNDSSGRSMSPSRQLLPAQRQALTWQSSAVSIDRCARTTAPTSPATTSLAGTSANAMVPSVAPGGTAQQQTLLRLLALNMNPATIAAHYALGGGSRSCITASSSRQTATPAQTLQRSNPPSDSSMPSSWHCNAF